MPVTPDSDPAIIMALQAKLEEYMLLSPGGYTPGVLDAITINAIAAYQTAYNQVSANQLPIIDPMAPVVDTMTLASIMGLGNGF